MSKRIWYLAFKKYGLTCDILVSIDWTTNKTTGLCRYPLNGLNCASTFLFKEWIICKASKQSLLKILFLSNLFKDFSQFLTIGNCLKIVYLHLKTIVICFNNSNSTSTKFYRRRPASNTYKF